jgi:hypothetical protein
MRYHFEEKDTKGKWKSPFFKMLIFAALLIIVILIRIFTSSQKELREGDRAFIERDYLMAVIHYERAIRYYLPFNPYVSMAISRLKEIEDDAVRRNEEWLAKEALRSLRGCALATQHFTLPKGILREVKEVLIKRNSPINLEDPFPSDPLWSFVGILGFISWTGGIVAFILIRLKCNGRGKIFYAGISSAFFLGLSLWIIGMINA